MTDPREALLRMLAITREDELDCDGFLDHLAELVEKQPMDPQLRALLDHHREICPECDEQCALLAKALDL